MIKTIKLIAPSFLAGALVNFDYNGLDQAERDYLQDWLGSLELEHGGVLRCVGAEDYGFTRDQDYSCDGADCQTYTFRVATKPRLKQRPLVPCPVSRGYIKVRGIWRYTSTSLHARINRRVGLWEGRA